MNVQIREAKASDLPAIMRIWEGSWDFHERRDPAAFRRSRNRRAWARFAARQRSAFRNARTLLVACEGEEVLGYLQMAVERRDPIFAERLAGFIPDMDVKADRRRQGIGTLLWLEAERRFRRLGVRRVRLGAILRNETSTRFYRKMGFRPYYEMLHRHV